MLARRRAHPRPYVSGAARANLAIVATFAVIASLLLTRTLVDSHGIRSDIDGGIAPHMTAVEADLAALPVLDDTGRAAERIATALLPIAVALGRIADATSVAARDTAAIRDDSAATEESVSGINSSVTAILGSLQALAPLVAEVAAGTGDIRAHLTSAQRRTASAAAALLRVLTRLHGLTSDATTIGQRTREIEAALRRIEGHAGHAARARVLQCPADVTACRP